MLAYVWGEVDLEKTMNICFRGMTLVLYVVLIVLTNLSVAFNLKAVSGYNARRQRSWEVFTNSPNRIDKGRRDCRVFTVVARQL